jgi:hypothetical protein
VSSLLNTCTFLLLPRLPSSIASCSLTHSSRTCSSLQTQTRSQRLSSGSPLTASYPWGVHYCIPLSVWGCLFRFCLLEALDKRSLELVHLGLEGSDGLPAVEGSVGVGPAGASQRRRLRGIPAAAWWHGEEQAARMGQRSEAAVRMTGAHPAGKGVVAPFEGRLSPAVPQLDPKSMMVGRWWAHNDHHPRRCLLPTMIRSRGLVSPVHCPRHA